MTSFRIWFGLSLVLWIIVILIPLVILPICTPDLFQFLDEAARPHGCTRTLYANTLAGLAGLLLTLAAMKRSLFLLSSLANMILGLVVILLPTVITGVCRMQSMRCVWGTKPGLIAAGLIVMAVGLAGVMIARKKA